MTMSLAFLKDVARCAIARRLGFEEAWEPRPLADGEPFQGLFVSLHSAAGNLRGCIGRIGEVARVQLVRVTEECAESAAFHDPRFRPLARTELDGLAIEISLLLPPEPVNHLTELDPTEFGVIVSCGSRRGILLPGIEQVRTPRHQLEIALQKAGIGSGEPYRMERFNVQKIR